MIFVEFYVPCMCVYTYISLALRHLSPRQTESLKSFLTYKYNARSKPKKHICSFFYMWIYILEVIHLHSPIDCMGSKYITCGFCTATHGSKKEKKTHEPGLLCMLFPSTIFFCSCWSRPMRLPLAEISIEVSPCTLHTPQSVFVSEDGSWLCKSSFRSSVA